ncbi:MAG: thiamine-phosphate kinase [Pseudomonadota bacterium]
MNEADFIASLRGLPLHTGARGLEDDCAVLEIGGETLIITHDMMAEGTHFRADADMADVAWKLVAANLSDLASKGAEPIGMLLGHSLGEGDERFLAGLHEILSKYDVPLLGGDTISAKGPRTLGLTAIGRATHNPVPDRGGAQVGHDLFVTGTLGRAMLGFGGNPDHLDAYNRPCPLVTEGQKLAPCVSAMMDISDGLLLDCWRMANASANVAFTLERKSIPVADQSRFDECIRWGDDYQLLFTADPNVNLPIPATRIGTVTNSDLSQLLLDEEILTPKDGLGYQHS